MKTYFPAEVNESRKLKKAPDLTSNRSDILTNNCHARKVNSALNDIPILDDWFTKAIVCYWKGSRVHFRGTFMMRECL